VSDYAAIGGVSATLQTLLEERMALPDGVEPTEFEVTVGVPKPLAESDREFPRVNLYLYRVTRNGELANQEIPGRGDAALAEQPPLPLNLHYLVTAYGDSARGARGSRDQVVAHYLLGGAMQVLHETPIVSVAMLGGDGMPILHRSLRGEYERVKLTLEALTVEDASKIWTALTEPFRVSAAYEASVVRIEPRSRRVPPQRIGQAPFEPPGAVTPAAIPRIAELRVRTGSGPERPSGPARIGDTLALYGSGFAPDGLRVRIAGADVTAHITAVTSDRVVLSLPDDPALRPGALSVQVASVVEVGGPEPERVASASGAVAFMLVPRVDALTPPDAAGDPWVVTGKRLYDPDVESTVLIGDVPLRDSDYRSRSEHRLAFDLPAGVPGGRDRVLRVRVNGAESIDRPVVHA
jgi:hypothetical protein